MSRIATILIIVALSVFALIIAVHVLGIGPQQSELANEICADTFGEEYTHYGEIHSDPPVLVCNGPNGNAYVKMPEELADELEIKAASYK